MTDDELITDIQEKVRTGVIDLRAVGVALGMGFDQDFPARLIALARIGAAVKPGYVVVPVWPTEDMIAAAMKTRNHSPKEVYEVYQAMLSALPQPEMGPAPIGRQPEPKPNDEMEPDPADEYSSRLDFDSGGACS